MGHGFHSLSLSLSVRLTEGIGGYIPLHPHQYPINSRFSRDWLPEVAQVFADMIPLQGPSYELLCTEPHKLQTYQPHIYPKNPQKFSSILGVIYINLQ